MLFVDLIQSNTYTQQFQDTGKKVDRVKRKGQVAIFVKKISNRIPYYRHPQED